MMVPKREQKSRTRVFWDENIETLDRVKLLKIQEERLREQLEYVYEFSGFYKEKFIEAGFHPHDFRSMEDIGRIPKTNKDEFGKRDLRIRYFQRNHRHVHFRGIHPRGRGSEGGVLHQIFPPNRSVVK